MSSVCVCGDPVLGVGGCIRCQGMVEQVGGDHYSGEYQHWDWVCDLRLHYLLATASKYVCRHRRKNGREDIEKAVSYLAKASEKWTQVQRELPFYHGVTKQQIGECTGRLAASTSMHEREALVCYEVARVTSVLDIEKLISELRLWYEDTENENMSDYTHRDS